MLVEGGSQIRVIGLDPADFAALEAEPAPPPPSLPNAPALLEEKPVWLDHTVVLFLAIETIPFTVRLMWGEYVEQADGSFQADEIFPLLLEKRAGVPLTGTPGAPTSVLLR